MSICLMPDAFIAKSARVASIWISRFRLAVSSSVHASSPPSHSARRAARNSPYFCSKVEVLDVLANLGGAFAHSQRV